MRSCTEHALREFSYCSCAALVVEHNPRRGEHAGVRSWDGDGPADDGKAGKIIDVVADVGDAVERDVLLCSPGGEGRGLVLDPVPHVDAQLGGAGGDNWMLLSGQDQHRHAGLTQQPHAHAIGTADCHALIAVRGDVCGVGGVHAVEVGDDGVDVDLGVAIDQRRDGLGERELIDGVDLDGP